MTDSPLEHIAFSIDYRAEEGSGIRPSEPRYVIEQIGHEGKPLYPTSYAATHREVCDLTHHYIMDGLAHATQVTFHTTKRYQKKDHTLSE